MNKLQIIINKQELEITNPEEHPFVVSYHIETINDFQEKRSSEAFDITVPATKNNATIANSYHDPNVMDMTAGQQFKNPQPVKVLANGVEILTGKALLQSAEHTDTPESYVYDMYGANGDWIIDLKEKTLWDFITAQTHVFDRATVETSWGFAGSGVGHDYVYAPVRYYKKFGENEDDNSISIYNMRPSLFIMKILEEGFKSVGYAIKSDFLNSDYFRRMVLVWTFGDFLRIDSKMLDALKFRAKFRSSNGTPDVAYGLNYPNYTVNAINFDHWADLGIAAGSVSEIIVDNDFKNGGYDNSDAYVWDNVGHLMKYTYPTDNFGFVGHQINFKLKMNVSLLATANSWVRISAYWYMNGVHQATTTVAEAISSGGASIQFDQDFYHYWLSPAMNPNDVITVRIRISGTKNSVGQTRVTIRHDNDNATPATDTYLEIENFVKPIGASVDFKLYDKLKEYKFLDFFGGVCDFFDLVLDTDNINKQVVIEPAHPHILNDAAGTVYEGFFKNERVDWQKKQDLNKKNVLDLYNASDREQLFGFKDDGADGGAKIYEERFSTRPGEAKFLFTERFKEGKNERYNRFFSPVMHVEFNNWKYITGIAPQFVAVVPERIGDTSGQNVTELSFAPKMAYYKGLVNRNNYGGWNWDGSADGNIVSNNDLPYLFAVNYKYGGQNDPILTYCDQNIKGVLGRGLLKRFFIQRMAIMEYGALYKPWMHLNNYDVQRLHREKVLLKGGTWLLFDIDSYNPITKESTKCTMWKYYPVTEDVENACYPSENSVVNQPLSLPTNDMRYARLLLLVTDLPK